MGKASKWLMSFLLGKKEKEKRRDAPPWWLDGTIVPAVVFPLQTTKVKRGWSFGKSAKTVVLQTHKPSWSLDSLESRQIVGQAKAEQYPVVVQGREVDVPRDETKAAATKIQAAFRSYLARKALSALRSLVKIQALVRGFLVRKQTTATMRSMHALMNIQVRACAHRILRTDYLNDVVSRQLMGHRKSSAEFEHRELRKELLHTLLDETSQISKSKSSHFANPKVERMEHCFTTYYSGDHSAQSTPRDLKAKSTRALVSSTIQKMDYATMESRNYPMTPHYMVNTESSRAKTRSQSEPKQRPKCSIKHKSKRNVPVDGMDAHIDAEMQELISRAKFVAQESREPWYMKLYRSRKALEEGKFDSTSTITTQSNHSSFI